MKKIEDGKRVEVIAPDESRLQWALLADRMGLSLSELIRRVMDKEVIAARNIGMTNPTIADPLPPMKEVAFTGRGSEPSARPSLPTKTMVIELCFSCRRKKRIGLPLESGCHECRELRGT